MSTFDGISAVQSFSPGWGKPEFLEKILVGREELVDRLEELAIDGAGGTNKHQRLIVGVRGSGKTHVLRVLHNRLWRNDEIKKRLLIIYLLEDELGVASFLDFVVRMLRAIVRWYPEKEQLARDLDGIYDLPADLQESRAVQLLTNETESKDALIIMENLGIVFDDVKGFGVEGQAKLRDLVQRHPHFMIFASSQALVEGARNPDRPFYGFFKVIHLHRLSLEEAMTLLLSVASAQGQQDIVDFLNTPKGRARVRAIHEFTGGNHRLLVSFYEFLTADSLAKLSELFIQALNPLKPYYQEQMRSLSAQQQKIIQYLSLQRTPCAVKEIARGCLAAPNTVSSQLKDLLEKSFVNKIEQGRESYYEVTETLFRICYEADLEQEGAPVRLFVDFLANLYTAQELLIRHQGFDLLAHKLGNRGSIRFADEAEFYRKAISLCHPELTPASPKPLSADVEEGDRVQSFFETLENIRAYREIVEFSRYLGADKDAFVLRAEASAHAHLGNADKARAAAMEAVERDPDDVAAHLVLAEVLSKHAETAQDALMHAHRAHELAPQDPEPLVQIAYAYERADNYAEALRTSDTLIQKHPNYARGWCLKGHLFEHLERLEEAEAAYRKALELDPAQRMAILLLGILVFNAGRKEEALTLFRQFTDVAPNHVVGWALTSVVLEILARTDEAEESYRKWLDLDPRHPWALERLSALVAGIGRHVEALALSQRLNDVAPDNARGWALTGWALQRLERQKEAEVAYRRALDVDPQQDSALKWLGALMADAGHHEEALGLFQRLNKAAPCDAEGWERTAEALKLLGRVEEASSVFETALGLGADRAELLNSRGEFRKKLGQYELALADYEEALRADPGAVLPRFNTISANLAIGNTEPAIAQLPKALETVTKGKLPYGLVVVQLLRENWQELFEHGPIHLFASYLPRALEIIETAGYVEEFRQSIPVTVFALLRDHETLDEDRFRHIVLAFEDILAKRMDVQTAVRFLQVGIDFLKREDRKALLRLTREERQTFCKELEVDDPGTEESPPIPPRPRR
jgi:tetratricopeptide (TPR) repeat protein